MKLKCVLLVFLLANNVLMLMFVLIVFQKSITLMKANVIIVNHHVNYVNQKTLVLHVLRMNFILIMYKNTALNAQVHVKLVNI